MLELRNKPVLVLVHFLVVGPILLYLFSVYLLVSILSFRCGSLGVIFIRRFEQIEAQIMYLALYPNFEVHFK